MQRPFWKGINWIYLGLMLFLGLGLVFLCFPSYRLLQCKSKQSEAKFLLQSVYIAQKLYFEQKGEYASLEDLQLQERVNLNSKYYDFKMSHYSPKHFTFNAVSKKGVLARKDKWQIDDNQQLLMVQDGCLMN